MAVILIRTARRRQGGRKENASTRARTYVRTHARTDGQVENTMPPVVHRMGDGGIKQAFMHIDKIHQRYKRAQRAE